MLYLELPDLERIVRRIEQSAPLFQAIAASPDLHGMAELAAQVARAVSDGRSPDGLDGLFAEAARTVEGQILARPYNLDWPALVELPNEASQTRAYVEAAALPDFSRFDPYARPMAELRDAARRLERQPGIATTIEVSGPSGTTQIDVGRGFVLPAAIGAVLVAVLLALGVAQVRSAAAVVLTLLFAGAVGLGIQTVVAGAWNPWSLQVAALALSLSSCLAVGFALRYETETLEARSRPAALALTGHRLGPCVAASTSCALIGLFVLLQAELPPTPRLTIAGIAILLLAVLATITLFPAALLLLGSRDSDAEEHWLDRTASEFTGGLWPRLGAGLAAAVLALSLASIPLIRYVGFSAAETALQSDTIEVLAAAGEPARTLARRLSGIAGVENVRWIESFRPAGESGKHEILSRLRDLLPLAPEPREVDEVQALRDDFDRLQENLKIVANEAGVSADLRRAASEFRRTLAVFDNPEPAAPGAILGLETALFARLGELLRLIDRLGRLAPLENADLDPSVLRRYVAPDGRWRIEIVTKPGSDPSEQIRALAPGAIGDALLETDRSGSLRRSLLFSLPIATSFLLAGVPLAFMRLTAVIPVLIPLLLSLLLFLGFVAMTAVPLTHANLLGPAVMAVLSTMAGGSYLAGRGAPGGWVRATLLMSLLHVAAGAPLLLSTVPVLVSLGKTLCAAVAIQCAVSLCLTPQLVRWMGRLGRPSRPAS